MHSAASILASVKEQEARFERLTRALEQERRHVALQLERAQQPGMNSGGMVGSGQPLPMAWQQLVLQVISLGDGKDSQVAKQLWWITASMRWLVGMLGSGRRKGK